ncbi:hypothetical protein KVR01_010318 [Diaporthe batatas]|uniref:phosphatidylinositol N-acetylglucosaminyltransferase GPI19 n=1 Tax=Diaporthe batatas TaxID=748121 RepID=UPI001D04C789|nr:phosphatidylinositol N-acetylglucosaminyltransferase GPI19 [Diaporthe batatas]KAG8159681.1 hypothetical protein KVR01_010318 [Diaporthe batatas]
MSLSSGKEEEEEDPFFSDGEGGLENEVPSDVEDDLLDDDEDEDDPFSPAQQPPPPTQSQMLSFGPPYYGRPPTPLPPSPSLTSLLRPSRPTTPDASDDEGLNSAEPVPRASPKVPTYEYYGFVLYLFSSLVFLVYLLWSYLPSPFLHVLGIYYYPNRWWSLAIPSFLVMLLVYIFVALALYNSEYLTLPLDNLETIVDDAGKIAVVDGRGRIVTSEERRRNLEREREREGLRGSSKAHHQRKTSGTHPYPREREVDWRECWNQGTDAVMDVPLAGVCEILYGGSRGEDDSVFNVN